MSLANFHLVQDCAALFRLVAPIMPPSGHFETDCGGRCNVAGFTEAFMRPGGAPEDDPWNFERHEEMLRALEDADVWGPDGKAFSSRPTRPGRGRRRQAIAAGESRSGRCPLQTPRQTPREVRR